MRNVMVDLETMGNGPRAAIVQIGAVAFGDERIGGVFSKNVSLESSMACGLKTDASTICWWMDQPKASWNTDSANPLYQALCQLSTWAHNNVGPQPFVWGCGASFDPVVLTSAYEACGLLPWFGFREIRCYRTIREMYPDVPVPDKGTHDALSDAIAQARHLVAVHKKHGIAISQVCEPNFFSGE